MLFLLILNQCRRKSAISRRLQIIKSPIVRLEINGHIVYEELREGNFGFVYKVQEKATGKLFWGERVADISDYKLKRCQVYEEISSFINLESRYISKPCSILEADNKVYFLSPYEEGEVTLEKFMNTHSKLPEAEAKVLFLSIIEGLRILHHNEIIHRGVNLSNILLHPDRELSRAKLTGFSFCKILEINPNTAHTLIGLPMFMAPETFKGNFQSGKVDVWGLGVLAYRVLVGRLPFRCNVRHELLKAQAQGLNPSDLLGLSPEAASFLKDLLTFDVEGRPNIEQVRQHPFFSEYQETIPVIALPRLVIGSGVDSMSTLSRRAYFYAEEVEGMPMDFEVIEDCSSDATEEAPGRVMLEECEYWILED